MLDLQVVAAMHSGDLGCCAMKRQLWKTIVLRDVKDSLHSDRRGHDLSYCRGPEKHWVSVNKFAAVYCCEIQQGWVVGEQFHRVTAFLTER